MMLLFEARFMVAGSLYPMKHFSKVGKDTHLAGTNSG
jgi:hypothetical protein